MVNIVNNTVLLLRSVSGMLLLVSDWVIFPGFLHVPYNVVLELQGLNKKTLFPVLFICHTGKDFHQSIQLHILGLSSFYDALWACISFSSLKGLLLFYSADTSLSVSPKCQGNYSVSTSHQMKHRNHSRLHLPARVWMLDLCSLFFFFFNLLKFFFQFLNHLSLFIIIIYLFLII